MARGVRFDIERQHRVRHGHIRRANLGVVVDAREALSRLPRADDLATAANIAVDQVAYGEAHIGLERVDAVRFQMIANGRRILRHAYIDAQYGLAGERPIRGLAVSLGTELQGLRRIAAANVEVRRLSMISNEKGATAFKDAVQVHDRRRALNAVARLQNEAAGGLAEGARGARHRSLGGRQGQRHMCVPPHTVIAWPVM